MVVGVLATLNVIGVKEAAGLNIFLALTDLATQALLVVIGLFAVFSPTVLRDNVHLGVTPSWRTSSSRSRWRWLPTPASRRSPTWRRRRSTRPATCPAAIMYVVLAVFAIYAFLPSVALSAMPVQPATQQMVKDSHDPSLGYPANSSTDRQPTSELAGRYANDPVAGLVDNLGLPSTVQNGLGYYVSILAATILVIATNAGIIGVSRLTYSMGQHRQLPEALRRVHPRYSTPYVAIISYSVIAVVLMIGNATFLGNLYAFGAMLSFTLAHAPVIWMRRTMPDDMPWRGPLSFHVGGYDVPGSPSWAASALDWRCWSRSGSTSPTTWRRSGSSGCSSG